MSRELVIPRRVLIVDDDASMRDFVESMLKPAEYQVTTAVDADQALTLLGREWFPIIITDRTMPGLDGLKFVLHVRASAIDPIYIIMLTACDTPHDYEQGYCAGVDYYMSKKGCEKELLAKVNAGVLAIKRRRASRVSGADGAVTIDLESGAHTARHLVGRLRAEIANAAKCARPLSIVSVCVESASAAVALPDRIPNSILLAVHGAIRARTDWVACLPGSRAACRIAVILPEADAREASQVEQLIRNAFVLPDEETSSRALKLTIGAMTQVFSEGALPTALELLGVADRNRRLAAEKAEAKKAQGLSQLRPQRASNG